MHDFDWFKAFFWGALGFLVGPVMAIGIWYLKTSFPWPTGEGIFATSMVFWFGLPMAFLWGLIGGPAIGFTWGLIGDRIQDGLYDVSVFVRNRFARRK